MPDDDIVAEVSAASAESTPTPPVKPVVHSAPTEQPEDDQPEKTLTARQKWKAAGILNTSRDGYNYALAFVLLANGIPLKKTAKEWGVDSNRLEQRALKEDWQTLIAEYCHLFSKVVPVLPKSELLEKSRIKIDRIEKNREKVISIADVLRSKIEKLARAFDNLTTENLNDTEEIANVAKAIASLTKAAKDITEMTMVAHGDEHAIKHMSDRTHAPNASGGGHGPQIVINMPVALAGSRRHMQKVSETLDEMGAKYPQLEEAGGNR